MQLHCSEDHALSMIGFTAVGECIPQHIIVKSEYFLGPVFR